MGSVYYLCLLTVDSDPVNSRKLLNDLMGRVGISEDKWISTCVLVDKLDKVELVALKKEIEEIGVEFEKMEQLCKLLQVF